jgi:PAS domain-containing protein
VILAKIALELSILVGLSLLLGVAQKDRAAAGRVTFMFLALVCMLWGLAELLVLVDAVSAEVGERMRYLGVFGLPVLWIGFAAHVAGLEVARRVPWFSALLLLPGACFYPLLYSSRWGSLFLETLENGAIRFGPVSTAWTLYAQVLLIVGSLVLVATALRGSYRGHPTRRSTLCLAAVLPLVDQALQPELSATAPVDSTPLVLGATLLALRSAAFSGGVLHRLPIAQRDLLHQLPFGVILTDRYGIVIEINDVAANRLQTTEHVVIGKSLGSVIAATGIAPLRSAHLRHWGRAAGEIVLV